MSDLNHVGFTGTQDGLTRDQRRTLRRQIRWNTLTETMFHHGDCIGADAEFHKILRKDNRTVIIHPPEDPKKRAFCRGFYEIRKPLPYKVRNWNIVAGTDYLIACPKGFEEEIRSGTWMTVRIARRMQHRILFIWPDGRLEWEYPK
jgi:hypothetical protein